MEEVLNLSQGHVLNSCNFTSLSYLQYSSVPALFIKGLVFHEARSLPYINSYDQKYVKVQHLLWDYTNQKTVVRAFLPGLVEV